MVPRNRVVVTLLLGIVVGASSSAEAAPREAGALEFFEKKVRPILVGNCYTCHSADTNSKGGLRVDDLNGLLQGGNRGPAIVPGHPEKSLLSRAVLHAKGGRRCPPARNSRRNKRRTWRSG